MPVLRATRIMVSISLFAGISSASAATMNSVLGYDLDARLKTARYSEGGCVLYDLDANGNRLLRGAVIESASPPIWGQANWGTATWTASFANSLWGSGAWGCAIWTVP